MLSIATNAAWEVRDGAAVDLSCEPFMYRITPELVADEPYALVVGGQVIARLREPDHRAFSDAARVRPMEVPVMRSPNVAPPPHAFWQYRDRVFFTDERPESAAGLLARMERLEEERAQHLTSGARSTGAERTSIPLAVKQAVWERDRGRCQSCGATYDLQFDRTVPVSMGGSATMENLQVRCDACIARRRLES